MHCRVMELYSTETGPSAQLRNANRDAHLPCLQCQSLFEIDSMIELPQTSTLEIYLLSMKKCAPASVLNKLALILNV